MLENLSDEVWLEIIASAANEVASVALGFEKCNVSPSKTSVPDGHIGAYLPLGSAGRPMQIALLAGPAGCQTLAKALLGMDPADEDLPDSDLSDAVSEILNVLAGGIKRGTQGRVEIQLGLPLFVKGVVQGNENLAILAADLELDSVSATVLLVAPRRSGAKRESGSALIGATPSASEA